LAPVRALLDSNILISYLLAPANQSPVTEIVRRGVLSDFVLLFPADLGTEMSEKAHSKPYLSKRIAPDDVGRLVAILARVSEPVPRIDEPIPAVTRDPKDDYLLAYAVLGRADYLVTGDRDLLVLRKVAAVTIVTPHEFLEVLRGPHK
jgi:putative PIN family toxin of toxin-antitoxin system